MNARTVLRVGIEVIIVAAAIGLAIYCIDQRSRARTEATLSRAAAEQARTFAADQQKLAAERQSEVDTARQTGNSKAGIPADIRTHSTAGRSTTVSVFAGFTQNLYKCGR